MFKLEIDTSNAAFEDDPTLEIAFVLGQVAGELIKENKAGELRDSNGNTVGHFELS